MKKIIGLAIVLVCLLFASIAVAEEQVPLAGFTLKQGLLLKWNEVQTKNLTTFEVARTRPVEAWGKWNALWAGWSIDVGAAYDATGLNSGAVLIGREFGTLGDYLPIDFPLKKFINITIYPIGMYVENISDHPKLSACSGGSIIKLSVNF